jgi:hypothetical protein
MPTNLKEVQPIDKPKQLDANEAKNAHIVEAAQLAIEGKNIRQRLLDIDTRISELSYILMTIENLENSQQQKAQDGTPNAKDKSPPEK